MAKHEIMVDLPPDQPQQQVIAPPTTADVVDHLAVEDIPPDAVVHVEEYVEVGTGRTVYLYRQVDPDRTGEPLQGGRCVFKGRGECSVKMPHGPPLEVQYQFPINASTIRQAFARLDDAHAVHKPVIEQQVMEHAKRQAARQLIQPATVAAARSVAAQAMRLKK